MKKLLIASLLSITSAAFAFADTGTTTTATTTSATSTVATSTPTIQSIFTACQQKAIADRDQVISKARNVYNQALQTLLAKRTDAVKAAIALTDEDAKQEALKAAAESYKDDVRTAQEALLSSRKQANMAFEAAIKLCKENKKVAQVAEVKAKKDEVTKKIQSVKQEVKEKVKSRK